jgi:hypothetical protein
VKPSIINIYYKETSINEYMEMQISNQSNLAQPTLSQFIVQHERQVDMDIFQCKLTLVK